MNGSEWRSLRFTLISSSHLSLLLNTRRKAGARAKNRTLFIVVNYLDAYLWLITCFLFVVFEHGVHKCQVGVKFIPLGFAHAHESIKEPRMIMAISDHDLKEPLKEWYFESRILQTNLMRMRVRELGSWVIAFQYYNEIPEAPRPVHEQAKRLVGKWRTPKREKNGPMNLERRLPREGNRSDHQWK